MTDTATNPLSMSDEDFLKENGPPEEEIPTSDDAGEDEDKSVETPEAKVDPEPVVEAEADTTEVVEGETAAEVTEKTEATEIVTPSKESEGEAKPEDEGGAATAAPDESEGKAATEAKAVPDEATLTDFYSKVMAPFKANGKMVELKSPEEVISMLQMGANYTRKMQELVPHRRVLTMLQNNNLLDEAKLSYLIDLDKKNPDAVKKLIKESGIDPLEIDTEQPDNYVGGNHTVSNEEVEFRTTLDELSSDEAGKETLTIINTQWDEPSKEILWSKPEVMTAIHEQRELGIYDKITAEVARRRTIGQIDPRIPFLQAYTETGDEMARAALEASGQTARSEQPGKPELKPVATRTATPKSSLKNGDKASAASPTRSAPAVAKEITNPLAMSDEEFLKQMDNRV